MIAPPKKVRNDQWIVLKPANDIKKISRRIKVYNTNTFTWH